ncbi:MAG: hypothetical protein H8E91_02865 [Planctomycetes bacterium]|nr:hypothetical protein [Planctomycetota bacterium]
MTTIKLIFISLASTVFVSSLAIADLDNGDYGNQQPKKITIFGHTGQDPAPEPGEATWDPSFSGPTWFDVQEKKKPLPTKDELLSIAFIEEVEITPNLPVSTPDWSTNFTASVDRLDDSKSTSPPYGGSVPAPPATLLFALGLLKKRRRVE